MIPYPGGIAETQGVGRKCFVFFSSNPRTLESPAGVARRLGLTLEQTERALAGLNAKGILRSRTDRAGQRTVYACVQVV